MIKAIIRGLLVGAVSVGGLLGVASALATTPEVSAQEVPVDTPSVAVEPTRQAVEVKVPEAVSKPVTETSEATTTTPPPVQEDDPGFNPCTQGNQGPCNIGTVLPNGARFRVTVDVNAITVSVVDTSGAVIATATDNTVTFDSGSDPLSSTLEARLPALFHQAAAQL